MKNALPKESFAQFVEIFTISDFLIFFLRPFERTLTLHKDSTGHIGFMFKEGKITAIVVESSAARNGLLIEHNLLEVNIV